MPSQFNTEQLRLLLAALPQPALVIDDRLDVVATNSSALELFEGNPAGQPLSLSLRSPSVLRAANSVFGEKAMAQASYAIPAPVARNIDIHVALLGQLESGVRIALLILHDLTYQEQVERMRADFVANASHELRTPLTSLTGFIETMQGPAKDDPAARTSFLAMMKTQADRMASLIDDLLSLSRIEINEHVPPTDTVDLVQVVKQVNNLLAPLAAEAGCELAFDMPQTLSVKGDAQQLSQVVLNLIENAIKYAGDGKKIDIKCSRDGNNAVLSVTDYGPGIAAHHVPRLTERFYRVSAQDSRRRGGTGLGLAIAKHIINRHRGRLLISSTVGRGSTFEIRLPASEK